MKNKKILSAVLVLALLVVLGLGIPVWATEGTVIDAATAEEAQSALDQATNNTTIRLKSGVDYGTLRFRQNESSVVVDITDAGGDAPGNEKFRKIDGITILGNGAVVDGFVFDVGWITGSGASFIDIKDFVIDGVVFSGKKIGVNLEGSVGSHLGIDGLTIKNCKMVDADHKDRLLFQQCTGYKDLHDKTTTEYVMTAGVKNVTITGCETDGLYMVTETRAMENLIITNNTFKNTVARDMLITSDTTNYPGVTYTGEITITGNTSDGGKERFVRMSGSGDAKVTITGNTIRNYLGEDEDYIKVTGANEGKVTIENNNFVYAAKIGETGYKTLQAALDVAEDGDIIEIQADQALTAQHIIEKAVIINGNGFKLSTSTVQKLIRIKADVTINDLTIENTYANGRCIETRVGGIELNLNNVTLMAKNTSTQALTVGGNAGTDGDVIVNLNGCILDAGADGYGIITYNPVQMQITNGSSINGYAALYMKSPDSSVGSEGSVVTVTGSELTSQSANDGCVFGTIVLEDDKITVTVDKDSAIVAETVKGETGRQYAVMISSIDKSLQPATYTGNTVNIAGKIVTDYYISNLTSLENVVYVPAEYASAVKTAGYSATDAGNGQIRVWAVHEHKLDKTGAVKETCTTSGNKEYYTCSICGLLFADEKAEKETTLQDVTIEATNHKIVHVENKSKTCTEDGIREHWYCEVCSGDQVSMNEELTKMVDYKEVVIPAGHRLMPVEAKAPTYTEPGNVEHYVCTMCEKKYADAETTKELTDVVIPQLIKVQEEKAEVSADAVDNAIADAKEKAEETGKPVEVVIEVPKAPVVEQPEEGEGEQTQPVQEVVKVELPVASLESVAQEEATLTVVLPSVTVTMDTETLKTVTEQAAGNTVVLAVEQVKTETLTEKQQEVVKKYDVAVTIKAEFICQETQEKIWTENNNANKEQSGSVTVKMPFTPPQGTKGTDYKVLYIADDGTVKEIETAFENGHLVFALEHFSEYVVVNAAIKDNPATIDSTMIAPFMLLFGLSFAGMAVMVAGKKQIV